MATTNASISISSDIMSYPTSINKSMTMKKAGSIGKLYGGDWMLIPWIATAAVTHNITVASSTTEPAYLEWMVFVE